MKIKICIVLEYFIETTCGFYETHERNKS